MLDCNCARANLSYKLCFSLCFAHWIHHHNTFLYLSSKFWVPLTYFPGVNLPITFQRCQRRSTFTLWWLRLPTDFWYHFFPWIFFCIAIINIQLFKTFVSSFIPKFSRHSLCRRVVYAKEIKTAQNKPNQTETNFFLSVTTTETFMLETNCLKHPRFPPR